jgi:hypothetical protein
LTSVADVGCALANALSHGRAHRGYERMFVRVDHEDGVVTRALQITISSR